MKKNTWKKMVLAGAGLTLAGSVLVACSNSSSNSSSSSSSKTIKLWVPTGAKESYSEVVKQFEEESGYTVKVVESNDSKAQENVKKDPEKAADVFSLPHDQLGQLVESGVIQEVPEEYANEIAENDTDQAVAGAQYRMVKHTPSHSVLNHKFSSIISLNFLKKMLLTMKQLQAKLHLVLLSNQ